MRTTVRSNMPFTHGKVPDFGSSNNYKGLRPEIILYKMAMIAITNKIWIKLLVAIPATTPKNPNTQMMIQITATSQSKLLMMLWF